MITLNDQSVSFHQLLDSPEQFEKLCQEISNDQAGFGYLNYDFESFNTEESEQLDAKALKIAKSKKFGDCPETPDSHLFPDVGGNQYPQRTFSRTFKRAFQSVLQDLHNHYSEKKNLSPCQSLDHEDLKSLKAKRRRLSDIRQDEFYSSSRSRESNPLDTITRALSNSLKSSDYFTNEAVLKDYTSDLTLKKEPKKGCILAPSQKVKMLHFRNLAYNPNHDSKIYMANFKSLIADQSICVIGRSRYLRENVYAMKQDESNVVYMRNPKFSLDHPYTYEWLRTEVDPVTKALKLETRCALCCYCKTPHFFKLRNSTFAGHMCLHHGIFADNYLTPDPIFVGQFSFSKKSSIPSQGNGQQRVHEGAVCPACYKAIEICSWKSTKKTTPLLGYFRHFKNIHRTGRHTEDFFKLHSAVPGPVEFQ